MARARSRDAIARRELGGDTPVFSVVVPTMGRATRLEICLAALASLDFPPDGYEVGVVNDGVPSQAANATGFAREAIAARMPSSAPVSSP